MTSGVLKAMTLVMITGTGCVRLDEDQCIVNGGDFACDEERICAAEIDQIIELSDRGDGCLLTQGFDYDFDTYFVHVKYGLPESLGARGSDPFEDLQSVTGVLVRAVEELEDGCTIDESIVRRLEPRWRAVNAVRMFLDRKDRVRADSAALEPAHVQAIEDFNDAIDEWVDECEDQGPVRRP